MTRQGLHLVWAGPPVLAVLGRFWGYVGCLGPLLGEGQKHFIKALYTSTLSKHFTQALYPSTLHKHFIKALYPSTLSKTVIETLYQAIYKSILEIPIKRFCTTYLEE